MEGRYTRTDAAREVMKALLPGDFHGPEYSRLCQKKLDEHGLPFHPMDGTWMRYLRQFGSLYKISLKDRSKSLYHKDGDAQMELF